MLHAKYSLWVQQTIVPLSPYNLNVFFNNYFNLAPDLIINKKCVFFLTCFALFVDGFIEL